VTDQRHRVVVIGGGFGGLHVAKGLAKADVDVTVLDRTNHHLFQPLLYEVATGILSEGMIAPALRSILKRHGNVRPLLADVQSIDLDARMVEAQTPTGDRLREPYDSLVVAAGATHAYFGHDEWSKYAPGMKTLEDARRLRSHILGAFEMAELTQDPIERASWQTFVVVGAGPTGIELTGRLAELAHRVLHRDYRSIDTKATKILLIDAAPTMLTPFHPKLQSYTRRRLERMGVEVRTSLVATDMDDASITVRTEAGLERVPARTKIWAAGVKASPLAELLAKACGAELDRAGRVAVGPDCSLPGYPEVFAIGDMASLNGLPGMAQPAIEHSLAPVWEANHVWLIFVLVVLWTAFPTGFASIASTLYVPLTLAALGMITRGAAFAFRKSINQFALQRLFGAAFAFSSLITPFFLGCIAGAVASGRVPPGVARGRVVSSWINPTSVLGGVLAVCACAYLASVFLCADAQRSGELDLCELFRLRAIASGALVGLIALIGVLVIRADAPRLFHGLTHRGLPLLVLSAVAGLVTMRLLITKRFALARACAALAVTAVVWGWAAGQYPYILQPGLTIADGAAPDTVLTALIAVLVLESMILIPSLLLLFWLFQSTAAPVRHPTDLPGQRDPVTPPTRRRPS
jgi:NADH dehydrogenase FAD-containing subunit/cytochrome bd-type quinol oxidase subunit 2